VKLFALLLLLPSFLTTANESAAAPAARSHCSAQEKVIFSCPTSKTKLVSVCSSSSLTATAGYLQYRFGRLGGPPEFTYPATQEHPKKSFQSGTLMFSGGGGAYLEFSSGGYKYVIFTGSGKGWEKEGVVVSQSGKQVAFLRCQAGSTSELGPDFFEKAAIPDAADDFEIP
jgi:hypothetical protein